MTASIDTPLLIIGGGPAALIVATLTSGFSLGSLIVGHQSLSDQAQIALDDTSLALLKPHGVLNVLQPYAASTEPFSINAALFEKVLKHHCVVNMNITVYDGMQLFDLNDNANGATARMSDGQSEWIVRADDLADTATIPADLNDAITQGATLANKIIAKLDLTTTN